MMTMNSDTYKHGRYCHSVDYSNAKYYSYKMCD